MVTWGCPGFSLAMVLTCGQNPRRSVRRAEIMGYRGLSRGHRVICCVVSGQLSLLVLQVLTML